MHERLAKYIEDGKLSKEATAGLCALNVVALDFYTRRKKNEPMFAEDVDLARMFASFIVYVGFLVDEDCQKEGQRSVLAQLMKENLIGISDDDPESVASQGRQVLQEIERVMGQAITHVEEDVKKGNYGLEDIEKMFKGAFQ